MNCMCGIFFNDGDDHNDDDNDYDNKSLTRKFVIKPDFFFTVLGCEKNNILKHGAAWVVQSWLYQQQNEKGKKQDC